VQLDLHVDEAGKISGQGRMVLTGNHAWLRSMWDEEEHPVVSSWKRWMEPEAGEFSAWITAQFPEFKVTVTGLAWNDEAGGLVGAWELVSAGPEEETDFISVPSAAPLGLRRNPFALAPEKRVTSARLLFPFVDDVELHITWPESWSLESIPESAGTESYIGKLSIESEKGVGELRYHRKFSLDLIDIDGSFAYEKLHELYTESLRVDTGPIVLVNGE
jgi:hypothetical protein